ncbi:hypothetical protein SmJEL517_g06021 [Synchytrium microbalum]|uniref:LysM domain-containing protein n=1 Tax=Synchytrium microbalum TaxID=1806994 RepID=A0A507BKS2_9FUNG|nr:uncharacterized protein SmJEL517_g06021 [Synchytrium microbalum]TPX30407.1 hypothetical protein SmJEL517_g06021 [Synchytrium microbalum]
MLATSTYLQTTTSTKRSVKHKIKESDTLAGIAIHYGIPIDDLKRTNRIWDTSDIHQLSELSIPLELCSVAHLYSRLPAHQQSESFGDTSSLSDTGYSSFTGNGDVLSLDDPWSNNHHRNSSSDEREDNAHQILTPSDPRPSFARQQLPLHLLPQIPPPIINPSNAATPTSTADILRAVDSDVATALSSIIAAAAKPSKPVMTYFNLEQPNGSTSLANGSAFTTSPISPILEKGIIQDPNVMWQQFVGVGRQPGVRRTRIRADSSFGSGDAWSWIYNCFGSSSSIPYTDLPTESENHTPITNHTDTSVKATITRLFESCMRNLGIWSSSPPIHLSRDSSGLLGFDSRSESRPDLYGSTSQQRGVISI